MISEAKGAANSSNTNGESLHDALLLVLKLDRSRLEAAGPKSDIYLIGFLDTAETTLKKALSDPNFEVTADLEVAFVKATSSIFPYNNTETLASPASARLGRAVRNLLCRVFDVWLKLRKGRTVFDYATAWLRQIGTAKQHPRVRVLSCLLLARAVTQYSHLVATLLPETVAVCLRNARSSSVSMSLRHASITCLTRAAVGNPLALRDLQIKDLAKALRSLAGDKSQLVQRGAAQALQSLFGTIGHLHTQAEVEATLNVSMQTLESSDERSVQADFVKLTTTLLLLTQVVTGEGSQASMWSRERLLERLAHHYYKPTAPMHYSANVMSIYARVLAGLGHAQFSEHLPLILNHLFCGLGDAPTGAVVPSRETTALHITKLWSAQLIPELLDNEGQLSAMRCIIDEYLRSPQKKTTQPMRIATIVLSQLIQSRGVDLSLEELDIFQAIPLTAFDADNAEAGPTEVLLQRLIAATPIQLSKIRASLIEQLQGLVTDMMTESNTTESSSQSIRKLVGPLFVLLRMGRSLTAYTDAQSLTQVMSLSLRLLRCSAQYGISIATDIVPSAWDMIASLMSSGPLFVQMHLPQLLLLWKNCIPKAGKEGDASKSRSPADWLFLLRVRSSALRAMHQFLVYNADLVTEDVSRRLVGILGHGLAFATSFASVFGAIARIDSENTIATIDAAEPYRNSFAIFRYRLLASFNLLATSAAAEPLRSSIASSCIVILCQPDRIVLGRIEGVQDGVVHGSGRWPTQDWQHGQTSLYISNSTQDPAIITQTGEATCDDVDFQTYGQKRASLWSSYACLKLPVTEEIEDSVPQPAFGSFLHCTTLVDAGVSTLAVVWPLLPVSVRKDIVAQVSSYWHFVSQTERHTGRRDALFINILVSLRGCLISSRSMHVAAANFFGGPESVKEILGIIIEAMSAKAASIRSLAAQILAEWSALGDGAFIANRVQDCITQVVKDTSAYSRAGCLQSLAAIYRRVGNIAAHPMLKTISDVQLSLVTDPHPIVHTWAMWSLGEVADAAGPDFAANVSTATLSIVTIYQSDDHDPDSNDVDYSAVDKADLPVLAMSARLLCALVSTLDTVNHDGDSRLALILQLNKLFVHETDPTCLVHAVRTLQSVLLFYPAAIPRQELVIHFRTWLASPFTTVRAASITSVYQLVKRDVGVLSILGGDRFVQDLFTLLEQSPNVQGIKETLTSWLEQTAHLNPVGWVELCRHTLAVTAAGQIRDRGQNGNADSLANDDEAALTSDDAFSASKGRSTPRMHWSTRVFVMECVRKVVAVVGSDRASAHLHPVPTDENNRLSTNRWLYTQITELIRMAFLAAASTSEPERKAGVGLLGTLLDTFRDSTEGGEAAMPLLQQYLAAMVSAVMPVFTERATVELKIAALHFCGQLVASRVWERLDDVNRIIRILQDALSACVARVHSDTASTAASPVVTSSILMNSPVAAEGSLRRAVLAAWAVVVAGLDDMLAGTKLISDVRRNFLILAHADLMQYAQDCVASGGAVVSTNSAGSRQHTRDPTLSEAPEEFANIIQVFVILLHEDLPAATDDMYDAQTINGILMDLLATSYIQWESSDAVSAPLRTAERVLTALRFIYRLPSQIWPRLHFADLFSILYRMSSLNNPSLDLAMVRILALLTGNDAQDMNNPLYHQTLNCLHLAFISCRRALEQGWVATADAAFVAVVSLSRYLPSAQTASILASLADIILSGLRNDQSNLVATRLYRLLVLHLCRQSLELQKTFEPTLHGVLSKLCSTLDDSRARDGAASIILAASQAIMTTITTFSPSPIVTLRQDSLKQCCDALLQTIYGSTDNTAAEAVRDLILEWLKHSSATDSGAANWCKAYFAARVVWWWTSDDPVLACRAGNDAILFTQAAMCSQSDGVSALAAALSAYMWYMAQPHVPPEKVSRIEREIQNLLSVRPQQIREVVAQLSKEERDAIAGVAAKSAQTVIVKGPTQSQGPAKNIALKAF